MFYCYISFFSCGSDRILDKHSLRDDGGQRRYSLSGGGSWQRASLRQWEREAPVHISVAQAADRERAGTKKGL